MPVVNTNTIKEWFRTLKKPTEDQFWAWLDSFRHKWEKVPLDDVEGLTEVLHKKADLVNGVVPEEQLPFSVVTSEVIALGPVTITGDKVNLPVHSSGANKVRVKGKTITRTFPNQWTFTPIADNGVKVLRGFAVKTEDDFFLAEGPELPEYEQPEIPPDALELFEFEVTANGVTLVQEDLAAYKLKANDGWANIYFNASATPYFVSVHHAGLRFNIMSPASGIKIGGINFSQIQYLYDGVTIYVRNETAGDLEFLNVAVTGNQRTFDAGELPLIIKQKETFTFAYHAASGVFKAVKSGGGGAELPPGTNGQIYEIDNSLSEKIKPSDRLTTAENEIDAEIVNRALADTNLQGQVTTEKNRNDTQDGQIAANANAIALKLDKPTTVIPNTEYLVGLDLNGDSTKISAGDLSFTSAFFTWNLTYMIPHSGTTYSTLKTGNPSLVGASASPERLSKAIRFSSSGATIAFQRGATMIISTNSGIGTIELITQRKFLVETNINTQRVFVGISNNYGTTNPGNSDFSALINTVGVILRESSPNWQFLHNNATGAPVITDTGLSHSSTHSFTWYFTSKNGVQKMILEKQSLATGVKEIAETTLTKFSNEVLYFHALFCIDKDETSPVRMLDFGAIMQTKGFFL